MKITTITTMNNLKALSLTFGLALSLPLIMIAKQPLLAETLISQNQNTQDTSQYKQIIYVDARNGNDQNGQGNEREPFKTITQALMISKPNTLILVASGIYNQQNGENFPLILNQEVMIKGNPASKGSNVIVEGNGFFVSPTGAGQNVTLVATAKAKGISGITVTNTNNRGHGIWIESANPLISDNTFTRNGNTGVSVNGNSAPIIRNNYFFNNVGNGLLVYGTSKPRIENNQFQRTGFGVSGVQNSVITLVSNTFQDNRIGVILEGNSKAILRHNTIANSSEAGLMTISQASADLGYGNDAGANIFRSNGKLDINNKSTNQIITAFGNDIRGKTAGKIDLKGTNSPINIASNLNNIKPVRPLPSLIKNNPQSPLSNNIQPTSSFTQTPMIGRVIDISAPTATNTDLSTTNKPPVSSNNRKMLPLPTKQPVRDTIIINGKPTPPAPNPIGNAIASNKTLPTPPIISEPYRKNEQNNSAEYINYTNSNNTITSNNTAIDIKPSNQTPPSLTTPPRYGNSSIQRRNLVDILLVAPNASNTAPPPGFNSNNTVINRNNTQAYNNRSTQYKIIVESKNKYQEALIRSLHPEAFRVTYKGRTMLQVGIFSNKQSADQVLQALKNVGLNALISY